MLTAAAASILASVALLGLAARDLRRHARRERAALTRAETTEARYRDGVEGMADGFTLWDSEDRLLIWNARVLELMPAIAPALRIGARRRDLIGQAAELLHPDWPAGQNTDWAECRRPETADDDAKAVVRIDARWIEIGHARTIAGGRVTRYRDVTAEKVATERLAESEARLSDFATVASDWFWETDAGHRFTSFWYGPRACHPRSSAMIGVTCVDWARRSGCTALDGLLDLEARMSRHETITGVTLPFPDGAPLLMEINGKPRFDAAGGFAGYRGTGRDVTAIHRQATELEHALRAQRDAQAEQWRFVSMASHEFRTPLAVIDGAAQRLSAQLDGVVPAAMKRLGRIRSAVAQMVSIIDRTLSSARAESGRIELHAERLDLRAALEAAWRRQSQATPGFALAFLAMPDAAPVDGDRVLLDQIFANLLSNATKYSGSSRRIEASIEADGGEWRIAIRDRGLGIPDADIPKLFTRFFRARTAMGISGTGIGLHLVAELVALHKGRIAVASRIGEGSTFTVWLPSAPRDTAADRVA